MTVFRLADRCPRLARARDQHEQFVADRRHMARVLSDELLSAERNLAHRELQLIRAGAAGSRSYIAERRRKLDDARAEVARLRRAALDMNITLVVVPRREAA